MFALVARVAALTLSVQAQSRDLAEAARRQEEATKAQQEAAREVAKRQEEASRRQEEAARAQQEATRLLQLRSEFVEAFAALPKALGPDGAPQWHSQISEAEFYKSIHPIPCRSDLLRAAAVPAGLLRGRPKPDDPEVLVVQPWLLGVFARLFGTPPAYRAVKTGGTASPLGEAVGDIRPDATIVPAADAGRPLTDAVVPISAIVEIKRGAAAAFTPEEMGQALGYGHRLIEKRGLTRLLVVAANTAHLHLWELVTAPSQPGRVLIFDFGVLTLEAGLGRLAAGLPLPSLFWLLERASFDRLMGVGATSLVFSLSGDGGRRNCVAKVVYREAPSYLPHHMADREREVLLALRDVAHVIRLHDAPAGADQAAVPLLAERTLVLAPRGTPLTPTDLLRRPELIRDLVGALRRAHAAGYVHCDLRFSNLYLDGAGALVIADWGFAFKAGDPVRQWLGTVVTASAAALLAMEDADGLVPQAADDLEGCVKLARLAVLERTHPAVAKDVNKAAALRGHRAVYAFWAWQLAGPEWARAMGHAEQLDYDALAEGLVGLLRART